MIPQILNSHRTPQNAAERATEDLEQMFYFSTRAKVEHLFVYNWSALHAKKCSNFKSLVNCMLTNVATKSSEHLFWYFSTNRLVKYQSLPPARAPCFVRLQRYKNSARGSTNSLIASIFLLLAHNAMYCDVTALAQHHQIFEHMCCDAYLGHSLDVMHITAADVLAVSACVLVVLFRVLADCDPCATARSLAARIRTNHVVDVLRREFGGADGADACHVRLLSSGGFAWLQYHYSTDFAKVNRTDVRLCLFLGAILRRTYVLLFGAHMFYFRLDASLPPISTYVLVASRERQPCYGVARMFYSLVARLLDKLVLRPRVEARVTRLRYGPDTPNRKSTSNAAAWLTARYSAFSTFVLLLRFGLLGGAPKDD